MGVLSVLVLIGPGMLLAMAVVALWSYGPLGWLASVLLLAAVWVALRWCVRLTLRWWASTKAPVQRQVRPSEARRTAR